jgi:hypothetical protein
VDVLVIDYIHKVPYPYNYDAADKLLPTIATVDARPSWHDAPASISAWYQPALGTRI